MAGTVDNPTGFSRTLHDVFRFLVDARGLPPFVGKRDLGMLQLDRLRVRCVFAAALEVASGPFRQKGRHPRFILSPGEQGKLSTYQFAMECSCCSGVRTRFPVGYVFVRDRGCVNAIELWPAATFAPPPSTIRVEIASSSSAGHRPHLMRACPTC